MKSNIQPLTPGKYFHIYNRGIDGNKIFLQDIHYQLFLQKYLKHVSPFVKTYSYCLLNNHFHFLIQVNFIEEIEAVLRTNYNGKVIQSYENFISRQFSHLFNGYAQIFNTQTKRTGSLFESPFRRIEIENDDYFSQLVAYIHLNPLKHTISTDYKNYRYSSYASHLSSKPTNLKRKQVLDWFGNKEFYINFHELQGEELQLGHNLSLEE